MNTKSLLNDLLSEINNTKQMGLFLKALFTNKELKELENRIKIFQLLLQGNRLHRFASFLLLPTQADSFRLPGLL